MDSTRPIRALMRGLDALAVLNSRDGASVSEIAAEIHLPRTTVHRILETLCDSGFAFRDSVDERYRLTDLVRTLSDGFDDEHWIGQIAKSAVDDVGRIVVWPVHLSTLSGNHMQIRLATDHDTPLAIERYPAGRLWPLLNSAGGLCYLAFCPRTQRDELLEREASSTRGDWMHRLDEIRRLGFATLTLAQRLQSEISLSVPIRLDDRFAVLTVRFLGSVVTLNAGIERFLPHLRQCAAKISHSVLELQAAARSQGASATAV